MRTLGFQSWNMPDGLSFHNPTWITQSGRIGCYKVIRFLGVGRVRCQSSWDRRTSRRGSWRTHLFDSRRADLNGRRDPGQQIDHSAEQVAAGRRQHNAKRTTKDAPCLLGKPPRTRCEMSARIDSSPLTLASASCPIDSLVSPRTDVSRPTAGRSPDGESHTTASTSPPAPVGPERPCMHSHLTGCIALEGWLCRPSAVRSISA